MKTLLFGALLALSTQFASAQDFQKFGSSGLVSLGNGVFQVVINDNAAKKIFNDMRSLRSLSGTRTGSDIVCANDPRGRGEKICSITILNSRKGTLGMPELVDGAVKMNGNAHSYHNRMSSTFSVLSITGGLGSAAQILWSNLERSTRSGVENQKAGERYTCDRFQEAPNKVEFRCEFTFDDRSMGIIGLGGVG